MADTSAPTRARARSGRDWRLLLALATVNLVWGSTYLAVRVMVETVPPLLGSGVRFLVAGAVLYPVLLARRGWAAVRVPARQAGAASLVGCDKSGPGRVEPARPLERRRQLQELAGRADVVVAEDRHPGGRRLGQAPRDRCWQARAVEGEHHPTEDRRSGHRPGAGLVRHPFTAPARPRTK